MSPFLDEQHPALLQATITLGLASLCALLYRRYQKPYFFWWAVAFGLYLVRLAAILTYLPTRETFWLFAHQVATGWTALALLWGALVFSTGARFRRVYLLVVLFPPIWAVFAIFHFHERDQFLFAALPAVAFLSGATLWTARVFFRFRRHTGSLGAGILGPSFLLWGLHHLDYPILRAQGAWNPWGYYLDIIFLLAVGAGILLLVLEDVERGLTALATLSGELQRGESATDASGALLVRALVLPGVRGSALYDGSTGRFRRAVGLSKDWENREPSPEIAPLITEAMTHGRTVSGTAAPAFAFAAVLPVRHAADITGALVIVSDARDPFTALNESFLSALGQQVGAALSNAELDRRLQRRTADLERLSVRMVQQHEDERRRLSFELHDETAQVFSAVKLQLGIVREEVAQSSADRLGRVMELVDDGMASIRSVTAALRPSLLDDLGLLPALRALAGDFEARTGVETIFKSIDTLPPLSEPEELALFRGMQEGLSNVARHAEASRVTVDLRVQDHGLLVQIQDDGRGLADGGEIAERMGLAGMRERFAAQGGRVTIENAGPHGTRLDLWLPIEGATE
jgi:signal transduction histidine kinase